MAGIGDAIGRLFSARSRPSPNSQKKEDVYQEVHDDQPYNAFSEVLLLTHHRQPVHSIVQIDDKRFVSVSDDHTPVVWDAETGRCLHTLWGHTNTVTCALPLLPSSDSGECCLIMTGSLDGSIRLWDLTVDERFRKEGFCQRISFTENRGAIKCLTQLSHDMICSGGQDLCLWDRTGRELSRYERNQLVDRSPVHSVLKLDSRHFGVVAASDYKSLAVFDINKSTMTECVHYELQFVRYLYNSHKEDICCLTSISANLFASGSCDGMILLWSTNTLSAMKMFQCSSVSPQSRELSSAAPAAGGAVTNPLTVIRDIVVVKERYLFAAVGKGFKVFDVIAYEDNQGHPKPLASHLLAHKQSITCMTFLIHQERSMLVTASDDGVVRLWGSNSRVKTDTVHDSHSSADSSSIGRVSIEDFLGLQLNPLRGRKRGSLPLPVVPSLLGEFLLHSGPVKVVKNLGVLGLATCGEDGTIILWKDAEMEREKKDILVRSFLKGEA